MQKRVDTLFAVLFLIAVCPAAQLANSEPSESDAGPVRLSESLVTHIESGPFGFFKYRQAPDEPQPPAEVDSEKNYVENFNFQFAGLLRVKGMKLKSEDGGDFFENFNFLRIAFSDGQFARMSNSKKLRVVDIGNPFDELYSIDQPLLCLVEVATAKANTQKDDDAPTREFWRVRVLDSLVFGLFQQDLWDDKYYYTKWFDIPCATPFSRYKSRQSKAVRFLDVLDLAVAYRYDKVEKPEKQEGPDGRQLTITKYERHQKNGTRWAVLDVPFVRLAESSKNGAERSLSILRIASFFSKRPLFFLWRDDRHKDSYASKQMLNLWFLGPLCASWQEAPGEAGRTAQKHWALLPSLTARRSFRR